MIQVPKESVLGLKLHNGHFLIIVMSLRIFEIYTYLHIYMYTFMCVCAKLLYESEFVSE